MVGARRLASRLTRLNRPEEKNALALLQSIRAMVARLGRSSAASAQAFPQFSRELSSGKGRWVTFGNALGDAAEVPERIGRPCEGRT